MVQRFIVAFLVILLWGWSATAQESDYCFKARSNWGALHQATCFEALVTLEVGKTVAKILQSDYQEMLVKIDDIHDWKQADAGYIIQELNSFDGATRVSYEFTDNARLIFSFFPYNTDFNEIKIVCVFKTEGESQLIFDGVLKKNKANVGTNRSMYNSELETYSFRYNNQTQKVKMNFSFLDGTKLVYFTFGKYHFRIPKN